MTEWWTYGLGDFLMFAPRTWYRLIELHNRDWWPLQPLCMLTGIGLMWAIARRKRWAMNVGLALLGLGLLFVAWSFHWVRYSRINLAAPFFAFAFALQGLLMTGLAVTRRDLRLSHAGGASRLAMALLGVSVLLYPLSFLAWARPIGQSEWLGLAPDPTMLGALAVALLLGHGTGLRRPCLAWALLSLLPLLWCAVSGATLWTLGAPDWWLLPCAGLLACVVGGWQCARRPGAAGRESDMGTRGHAPRFDPKSGKRATWS